MQNEKVVETKTCKHCEIKFEITDKDLEFYEKVSPIFAGKKYNIPTPKLCPDCRQQRRLSFRNERKLYKRKCDFSGKDIISIYSPDKKYKVYDQEIWWSDKWDALDYGKDFDFSKSFFEQFEDLMKEVPRISVLNGISENSDYTNHSYNNKNCYLSFEAGYNENSFYSTTLWYSKDCIDCEICHKSNNCYQCQNITNCSKCFYSRNLTDSYNCYFCIDCIGCKNCFGIENKTNKEYLIYDKSVSKEEFESFISNYSIVDNKENIFKKRIVKNLNNINCENCLGDNLINSKNSSYVFDCNEIENIKYSWKISNGKNSYDYDIWGENSENIYEVHCTGTATNVMFSNVIWGNSNNILYSDNCLTSNSNLFGCIGLRNKSYCILNKQYTKEEYEILVPKIIEHMISTGEWGEFFPSSISPFGYNETVAQEYFPLPHPNSLLNGEGIVKGTIENNQFVPLPLGEVRGGLIFNWSSYEPPFPKVEKIIKAEMLPENISDIPDDILNWAIECEITKKPFRIIKQELEFYRKHNLPIPKRHPDQRHLDRMSLRNPRKLFDRKCDKCRIDIKTTYSPERPEIVYCEECYNKEIY